MSNLFWGSEDYYNPPATAAPKPTDDYQRLLAGSGMGTPSLWQFTSGEKTPQGMLALGDTKFDPFFKNQLSGLGISQLPAWMNMYASNNWDHENLAEGIQNALGIDPTKWASSNGKTKEAMRNVGINRFDNGKAYDIWGTEIPWDENTKSAVQQSYLNRLLKENTGGFNPLGAEGLGLASVLLPIAGGIGLAAGLGGAGAGAMGGVGGGIGGGGIGVPTTAAELGALGGSGGIGGGGMGLLDSLGGLFGGAGGLFGGGSGSSFWPSLIQGGLGVLGSYLGGDAQKDAADKSADVLWAMYNQNRSDMSPLLRLLGQYTGSFADLASGKAPIDYQSDPMFKADKKEMMRTLNRGQASLGKLRSSDTDNAIVRNLSTLQNQAYQRKYGGLLDLLKLGSGAASSAGSYGANTGNALAGVYGNAGNAQANMYGGMFASGMGALNNWQLMQLLANMKR